jgi:hypothetical protein
VAFEVFCGIDVTASETHHVVAWMRTGADSSIVPVSAHATCGSVLAGVKATPIGWAPGEPAVRLSTGAP